YFRLGILSRRRYPDQKSKRSLGKRCPHDRNSSRFGQTSRMNQLVLIALRRPYTFVVMTILIVLFGSLTVLHMPTDVFPNIGIPVTSVVWVYACLLPQQVEGRITYLFERFLTATV